MDTNSKEDLQLSPNQVLVKKLHGELTLNEMKQVLRDLHLDRDTNTVLNSASFVDILQSHKLLTKDGGKQLYESLIRRNLNKVASYIQNYEDLMYGAPSTKKFKKDPDQPPDELRYDVNLCPDHPEYKVELFCNSCNKKVCFQCVFLSHKDKTAHNILTKKDIEGQIEISQKHLQDKIHKLKNTLESLRENVNKIKKKENAANIDLVQAQTAVWENLLKRHEKDMLIALAETKEALNQKVDKLKLIMLESEDSMQYIRDLISKGTEEREKLRYFEILCNWKQKLVEMGEKVQNSCQERENVRFLFRPFSKVGVFAEVRIGNVVGAVALSMKYALVVKDERLSGSKITLACVAFDTQRALWQREIEDFSCDKPVILVPNVLCTGVKIIVLIGLGRTLTCVFIQRFMEECSIQNVISFTLDKIPDDAYITAITTVTSGNRDIGMLIANNASTTLHRFSPSVQYEGSIDCSSSLHSIYSVACVDNDIAVIDSVCQEVVVLKVKGDDVMLLGKLNVAENSTKKPKMIQWDGNLWSVLYVSKEDMDKQIEWETVNFMQEGRKFNSSGNGKCKPKTTAVSISFIRDVTVACFSDGTINKFPTVIQ